MKYFCVSDIHSHYDALKKALDKAGFDEGNNSHKVIVIGDLFDRGSQTIKVLEYLYNLQGKEKALFILGNHDVFLLDFLEHRFGRTAFNFTRNGHQTTIEQLVGYTITVDSDFKIIADEINLKFPYLKAFLSSFKNFIEIDNYILVHGGVDATKEDWRIDEQRTFVWTRMLDKETVKDKVLIVGHTPAFYVKAKQEKLDPDYISENSNKYQEYFDIYDQGDLIHIDGGVYSGGRINVFTFEK